MKVTLFDKLGSDLTVVQAARVSFAKASEWEWEDVGEDYPGGEFQLRLSDRDARLIRYLARHGHFSPFAHPQISLHVRTPVFVARQLFKHVVGFAPPNEVSRRYVDQAPELWAPAEWRGRPEASIKQGSGGPLPIATQGRCALLLGAAHKAALDAYEELLNEGVAPEQARAVLPLSLMTSWVWTGSLAAFARVCRQRLDPHAQAETREVAEQIAAIVRPLFPVSWAALMENER